MLILSKFYLYCILVSPIMSPRTSLTSVDVDTQIWPKLNKANNKIPHLQTRTLVKVHQGNITNRAVIGM